MVFLLSDHIAIIAIIRRHETKIGIQTLGLEAGTSLSRGAGWRSQPWLQKFGAKKLKNGEFETCDVSARLVQKRFFINGVTWGPFK